MKTTTVTFDVERCPQCPHCKDVANRDWANALPIWHCEKLNRDVGRGYVVGPIPDDCPLEDKL